jgi:integrase
MTKRQFGRIRQMPSGRWQARYNDGAARDVPAPQTFATKGEANRWLSSVQTDISRGVFIDPRAGRETLAAYAERWLTMRVDLRPKTVGLYRTLLDRCILPTLGTVELGKLTPSIVRSWHADLIKQSRCGPSLVPKAYRLLHTILATAVADELVIRNPCAVKGASSEHSAERVPATVAEVYAVAERVPLRYRALVLMAALSGLREGELFALTRMGIDLLHRTVTVVEQQVEPDKGPRYVGPPKTDAGRRIVTLPEVLMPELDAHLAQWVASEPSALVFTAPQGGPINRHNFSRVWRQARLGAQLPDGFTFHDLRHTANLLAASTGASTAELMARMGHSSPRAALRYQHATRERDAAIAEAMSAAVAPVASVVPIAASQAKRRASSA